MYDDDDLSALGTTSAPSVPTPTSQGVQGPAVCKRSSHAQRQAQFDALAASVANRLYATALRWSKNHAHAEDLVQETFLCAWRNFDRFTLGTNFNAWVSQILRFLACNWQRSTISRQSTMDFQANESLLHAHAEQEEDLNPFDTHWDSIYPDLVDDALKRALDRLTPPQRTLALCIPLGGLSYQECADELGIPVGTVMSRYARARAKLQQELERDAIDGGCCGNR